MDDLQYRYAVLRSRLAILLGFICLLYLFIDVFTGIYVFLPWQLAGIAFSLSILILNRRGQYHAASVILLVILNLLIFLFAAADDPSRGVYFYFIASASFSFILFYPQRRDLAFFFAGLSIVLAMVSLFTDFKVFEAPSAPTDLRNVYFMINFIIGVSGTLFIILFAIQQLNRSRFDLIKHQEILEKRNVELSKVNMELDSFLYKSSHDIRAPISTIAGLIYLIQRSESMEEIRHYNRMTDKQIKKLNKIISDITLHSRNLKLDPEIEEFDARELCQEVLDTYSFLLEKSGIRTELDINGDLIKTDRSRLRTILSNLVSNSINYFNPSINHAFVRITCDVGHNGFNISVSDNGIGIAKSHQDKVFDMFYRGTEKSQGSGLGLYITKEMVERLNGRISLSSVEWEGTTVGINLPGG